MSRLIDGDALKEKAWDAKTQCGYVQVIDVGDIDDAPTIEPEREVGEWIDQKGGGCCCSKCGRYALDEVDGNFIHVAVKSNYCPNCGTKMDGSERK